jgi:hypothetical protein
MAKVPSKRSPKPAAAVVTPTATPMELRGAAAELFAKVVQRYAVDEVATALLRCACESLQRAEDAAAIVTRDGLVVYDRFGAPRNHPAALLERDHRNAAANSLQKLGLQIEG